MRSLMLAVGVLVMADVSAEPEKKDAPKKPATTTVVHTGYNADGTVRYNVTDKEKPLERPYTTTVTVEVYDPKTGKLVAKTEGVPAMLMPAGHAWQIGVNFKGSAPGKGDRITDADGKAYTFIKKPQLNGAGFYLCEFKVPEKKS